MRIFKRNGFSLVELVVSMLVVSIGMLGFASLLAFSSKTIHSNYSKNLGTDQIQAFSMLFQESKDALKNDIGFDTDDTITFDCTTNIPIESTVASNAVNSFNDSFTSLCATMNNIPGVLASEIAFSVTHKAIVDVFDVYTVQINFAYQTNNNDSRYATNDLSSVSSLVDTYCSFDSETRINAEDNRINDSVVCNSVEVRL